MVNYTSIILLVLFLTTTFQAPPLMEDLTDFDISFMAYTTSTIPESSNRVLHILIINSNKPQNPLILTTNQETNILSVHLTQRSISFTDLPITAAEYSTHFGAEDNLLTLTDSSTVSFLQSLTPIAESGRVESHTRSAAM